VKQSRFTEEQIIQILKEGELRGKIDQLCRRYGISKPAYYKWKAKFGGMDVSEAKRLRSLQQENSRLKKLVADLSLDNSCLRELLSKKW
jgi:putative transposase